MNNALILCPKCRAWLLEGVFNQPDFVACPACATPLQAEVFPALFRKPSAGQSGEAIVADGESSCFYHPQKRAAVSCDGCGRFLCPLCDCGLDGRHFCPGCLESGRIRGKIQGLVHQRTRYDKIALALALYPVLLFYLTIITAPIALFVAIRYWKAPTGLLRPTRSRYIAAIVISLLQIGGWVAFFSSVSIAWNS
jgi:hypothetical protein